MVAVSVLIPCKGDSPYLLETLASIFSNTVLPDEILIVNDGMTSKALAEIYTYTFNKNFRVINNRGAGLVDALNTGINASKNELVIRIDSDDLMEQNRIKVQYDFMIQNPATVVLGSQCTLIDKLGVAIGKTRYPVGELNKLWKFRSSCQLAHPSVIFRKSIVISAGGYRKVFKCDNMDIAEDFDLWLRMAKFGSIQNLDIALTKYRQHENQISSKFSNIQILATLFVAANVDNSKKCKMKTEPNCIIEDYQGFLKILGSQKNKVIMWQHRILLKKLNAKQNRKYNNLILFKILSKLFSFILELNQVFLTVRYFNFQNRQI